MLRKSEPPARIVRAIEVALAGETVATPDWALRSAVIGASSVGRDAPTKVDLHRRAVEDRLGSPDA